MELTLRRIAKRKGYTIGRLLADGEYICDTLEPTWRDIRPGGHGRKVPGRTAIPEGRYAVVVTRSARFGKWLPLLLGVPLFEGIRIHAGNLPSDTQGCILPGENKAVGQVWNSRRWVGRVIDIITQAKEKGEGVWITVE